MTLGHIESVKLLIEAGADVNCEKDGWTGEYCIIIIIIRNNIL